MSQTISLCIFCREENAFLTKHTLNSALTCLPGTWSEIVVIDLFFLRKDRIPMPSVKFCSLDSVETDILKFTGRNTKGEWLLLLEAGEVIKSWGKSFEGTLSGQKKTLAYYIPLSGGGQDGWQPAFSPRLRHRSSLLQQNPDMHCDFLWDSFSISRKFGPRAADTLFETQENLSSPAGMYRLAETICRQGNDKRAADLFSRAYLAVNDPRLKRFFTFKKIYCLFKSGQSSIALEQLVKGEKYFSSPVEFIFLKGKILLTLRRYRESLLSFEQAASKIHRSPAPPYGPEIFVITTGRAEAMAALQQRERALDSCIHALACCPGYYPALQVMAKTAFLCYPPSDAVRLIYRHGAPLQQEKYGVITRILLDNEKIPEAYTCVKSGLKERPGNLELLFLKAYCCLRQGQIIKCPTILRKIPPNSPFYREAFLIQCLCFWALKDYRRALQLIESPQGQNAEVEVRDFCRSLHFYILHQEKSLAVQPFLPSLKKNNALYLRVLELSLSLANPLVFNILVGLAMKQDQGKFSLALAKLLAHKKEEELAVTFFNKALDKGAYDSESLLIMGKIALDENLFSEARELFSLALKNFPQDAGIYLIYAHTLLKEAALTLQDGLQQNPAHATLQKAFKEVGGVFPSLDPLKLDF